MFLGYVPVQQNDPKMMKQQRLAGYHGYRGYQPGPLITEHVYNSRSDIVAPDNLMHHHDNQRCSSTATMFGRSGHVMSPYGPQQNIQYAPAYLDPNKTPVYKNHALLRHQFSREALSDVTTKSRPRMMTRV